jgi:predicted permease
MKTIIGIVLIIAGIALFLQGLNRKDSLAGQAATAGTSIANSIDGGARTPKHVGYMVGGGALVVVGVVLMARRGPRSV